MLDIKTYTLKETADILQVSERTVLTYLYKEKLRGQKIGGKWIIAEDNIKAFITGL